MLAQRPYTEGKSLAFAASKSISLGGACFSRKCMRPQGGTASGVWHFSSSLAKDSYITTSSAAMYRYAQPASQLASGINLYQGSFLLLQS
jgi:hypothetical protein